MKQSQRQPSPTCSVSTTCTCSTKLTSEQQPAPRQPHLLRLHHVVLGGHQGAALAAAVDAGRVLAARAAVGAALLRLAERRGVQAAGLLVLLGCLRRAQGVGKGTGGQPSCPLVCSPGAAPQEADEPKAAPAWASRKRL